MKDLLFTHMGYSCTKLYIKDAQGKKMWLEVGKRGILRIATFGKRGRDEIPGLTLNVKRGKKFGQLEITHGNGSVGEETNAQGRDEALMTSRLIAMAEAAGFLPTR